MQAIYDIRLTKPLEFHESMTFRTLISPLLIIAFTAINFLSFAQDEPSPGIQQGEKLFKANCASCHKVDKKLIGPALLGAPDRWDENGEYNGISGKEWLYRWIRNSQEVINEGHPYAVKLFNEYNKSVMTAFTQLSDEDITNIIDYVNYEATREPDATVAGGEGEGAAPAGESPYTKISLYILLGMLVLIVLILSRVIISLNKLIREKEGLPEPIPIPFYKNKKLITTAVLVLIIYIGYTTVNSAIDLGRQQGYMPVQPVKFSHKLHAGINKIDCQYCHTSADKGKHSNIPSASVCMNCHKGIQEGAVNGQFGRKEIAKIYASLGFDPTSLQYIDDYENMPVEEAQKIYAKWLTDDPELEYSQSGIDEVLAQVQQPIEWVRIHNLPDHVYFNHSQHVVAGNLQCQTCHGPVEEMDEVYQFAPLSMGWCISCHRQESVNFANNDYYNIYEKFHEDLKAGKISTVTVEDIGGTDCQKCHY